MVFAISVPNIFIGMDFGKANIPWWATWILVAWVIFHIIVELSLEVHQCCTYKKNKGMCLCVCVLEWWWWWW